MKLNTSVSDLLRLSRGLSAILSAQASLLTPQAVRASFLRAILTPCPTTTTPTHPPSSAPQRPPSPPQPPPQPIQTPPPPSQPNFKIRQRRVPQTSLSRALSFTALATRLLAGAAAESTRRMINPAPSQTSPFLTDANFTRLATSLSHMRGAALKLGQMLSIQDDSLLPAPLLAALDRVRHSADIMPQSQLHAVLARELGPDWSHTLRRFDDTPVAAASIGQVHRAYIVQGDHDEEIPVAVKVQYPGVARSITSDLSNLKRLLSVSNLIPPNFFVDEALAHAEEELARECDYTLELANQHRYRTLVQATPSLRDHFHVPPVFPAHSTSHVLVSQFVPGRPVDTLSTAPRPIRDKVASNLLRLTLSELFIFAFQQSDPNWSNYLYDDISGVISLIDFGAARAYENHFLLRYLNLIRSCAAQDRDAIIQHSVELGFLTGEESLPMIDAHVQASFAVGEPFQPRFAHSGFDFTKNDIPARAAKFGKVMLQHRLTPPPKEVYSLHRRLSGAFLMSTRLGATINAARMLEEMVQDLITQGRLKQ